MRRRALLASNYISDAPPISNPQAPIGVSIATQEGNFIPYAEWAEQGTAVGVAVRNTRRTLILSLTTFSVKWSTTTGDVDGVPTFSSTTALGNYVDGETYTRALASASVSSSSTIAAVALSKTMIVGEKVLTGYLPSTGEWKMVEALAGDIEAAYSVLGITFAGSPTNYWSSCEKASGSVWICAWTIGASIKWTALSKTNARVLRPFFLYENYEQ